MNRVCIIQARVSSTRLLGKVLKPLFKEQTMLSHIIERVRFSKKLDTIIVATSSDPSDDPIESLCNLLSVNCYRGSLNDVLSRYYHTAIETDADVILRVTADCPLIDYQLIDTIVETYQNNCFDYISNTAPPTFPDGLDLEIFSFDTLEQAYLQSTMKSQREHVTLYIKQHPELFKLYNYTQAPDLSHLRWTVDEIEDLNFIKAIYKALYPSNPKFTTEDVLAFLSRNTTLSTINTHINRNAGLKRSLEEDEQVTSAFH